MSNSYYHSLSSVKRFGGKPEDYSHIHEWFDQTKEYFADFRHRALRHHSQGIFECEKIFGKTLINSDKKVIPTRLIAEYHIKEDCGGRIPTIQDWLEGIPPRSWMNCGYKHSLKMIEEQEKKKVVIFSIKK